MDLKNRVILSGKINIKSEFHHNADIYGCIQKPLLRLVYKQTLAEGH